MISKEKTIQAQPQAVKSVPVAPVTKENPAPQSEKPAEVKEKKVSDLLDIFREEEKEDKGLLTEGLDNVVVSELVDQADDILNMIKTKRRR